MIGQDVARPAALPAVSRIARTQTYPARPVHLIVGYPAGGPQDIVARLMGQWLSEQLGQPFVIDNRLGAGGNVGTELVVRALPDGHTLLLVGSPNAINASLYDKLNFVFLRDIVPAAAIIRVPMVVLVHPSAPARTVPEFIAYVRANPGNVNFASAGIGTRPRRVAEFLICAPRDAMCGRAQGCWSHSVFCGRTAGRLHHGEQLATSGGLSGLRRTLSEKSRAESI